MAGAELGVAPQRLLASALAREPADALASYRRFSAGHSKAFSRALAIQRLIPALPPRLLTAALKLISPQPIVDRAFGWYLDQAHPNFATAPSHTGLSL